MSHTDPPEKHPFTRLAVGLALTVTLPLPALTAASAVLLAIAVAVAVVVFEVFWVPHALRPRAAIAARERAAAPVRRPRRAPAV